MKAHRVRKRRVEHPVVSRRDRLQNRAQAILRASALSPAHGEAAMRGSSMTSNGHTAQKGTTAAHDRFSATMRSPAPVPVPDTRHSKSSCRARQSTRAAPQAPPPARSAMLRGPDLSMRMRIARAHHRAAVLEDLHVRNVGARSKLGRLRAPTCPPRARIAASSIVASVRSWRGSKQSTRQTPRSVSARSRPAAPIVAATCRGHIRLQRGEVVLEHKGASCTAACHGRRRACCPGRDSRSGRSGASRWLP